MAAPLPNQNNTAPTHVPLPGGGAPVPIPMGAVPIPTHAPLPNGVILPLGTIPAPVPPPLSIPLRQSDPTLSQPKALQKTILALKQNAGIAADRNDSIIYGYIRCNYNDPNNVFPVEIIKMIISFYDDGFFWHFTHEQIKLFDRLDRLVSIPIIVNDTIFHYELHFHSNYMFYCLRMKSMPKDIEYMMIYFELHLVETDHYYKDTHLFGTFMPSNERKYVITTLNDIKFQSMTFRGRMDVLHVRYRSNDRLNADPRFMNLTKMRTDCSYEWKVNASYLKSVRVPRMSGSLMRTTPFLYSASFNRDVFSLYIERIPVNETIWSSSGFRIGVKVYRLPNAVKRLLVLIVMKINNKKYSRKAKISCGWEYAINIPNKIVKHDIQCKVTIKTKKAFNYEDKEIQTDAWKQYGIL